MSYSNTFKIFSLLFWWNKKFYGIWSINLNTLLVAFVMFLSGCGSKDGGIGPQGPSGKDGQSCSSQDVPEGTLIECGDDSDLIYDGTDGDNGVSPTPMPTSSPEPYATPQPSPSPSPAPTPNPTPQPNKCLTYKRCDKHNRCVIRELCLVIK